MSRLVKGSRRWWGPVVLTGVVLVLLLLVRAAPSRGPEEPALSPLSPLPTPTPAEVVITPTAVFEEATPTPWPTFTPRPTPTRRPGPTATPIPPRSPAPHAAGTLFYVARPLDNAQAPFQLYGIAIDPIGQPGEPFTVLSAPFELEGITIGRVFASPNGHSLLIAAGSLHTMFPYLVDTTSLAFRALFQSPFSGRLFGWHPDGHTALVWMDEGPEAGLWLVDVETGTHTVLTLLDQPGAPASPVQGAAVSPDGQWVAFIAPSDVIRRALWLVSTAGGDARVISRLSGVNYLFSWSPDNAFVLYAGGPAADTSIVGGPLWLINVKDQNHRPLSSPFIFGWSFEPGWSPDGQWIASTGLDKDQHFGCAQKPPYPDSENCRFEGTAVYIENVQTGEVRRLASGIEPVWSPDGSMLAFLSDQSGAPEIWLIQTDGSGLRQITSTGRLQFVQFVWVSTKGNQ